jgi:hypothetical protein
MHLGTYRRGGRVPGPRCVYLLLLLLSLLPLSSAPAAAGIPLLPSERFLLVSDHPQPCFNPSFASNGRDRCFLYMKCLKHRRVFHPFDKKR